MQMTKDWPDLRKDSKIRGQRVIRFQFHNRWIKEAFLENEELVLNINNKKETLMHVDELALRGRHNVYNSLAAAVAARVMEVRSDVVRESLRTFEGVPHRLEPVREVEGVRYVNDSKATNVNAVWYALESFKEPIIWIAGGRDKGNDYAALQPLVQKSGPLHDYPSERHRKLCKTELGHHVDDSVRAEDLEEAIKLATVACSSRRHRATESSLCFFRSV